MTPLGILIPKGWILLAWITGTATAVIADIRFTNTVTVGSIIVASMVIVLSGALTIRNNVRSFWRGLAEERAEKIVAQEDEIKERDARIRDLQEQARADMLQFAEEQRTIRHELKNQLRGAEATLQVEQAKTDLTALMELLSKQHSEAMTKIAEGLGKQDQIVAILAGVKPADLHVSPSNPQEGGS